MAEDSDDDHPILYPLNPESYSNIEEIGKGPNSTVHRAICTEMNSAVVAIKVMDLEKSNIEIDYICSRQLNHPTLVRPHCFFTVKNSVWIVMPFIPGGSLQSIIASSYPDGLPESCIAAPLKEILTTLSYLHGESHSHGGISASNILVDSKCSVRLADSSMSSSRSRRSSAAGSRYYWMTPEVAVAVDDIWSFGMTALELAHGRPPLSNSDHLPPSEISQSFKNMVGACLALDPSKRPTAEMLLDHPFFQNCGGTHLLIKNMLPKVEQIDRLLRKLNCEDQEGTATGKIRRWKFNEERFVLDPIIEEDEESSAGDELDRGQMLRVIKSLLGSLDYRRQRVQKFIEILVQKMTTEELMQVTVNLLQKTTKRDLFQEIVNQDQMELVDRKNKYIELMNEFAQLPPLG